MFSNLFNRKPNSVQSEENTFVEAILSQLTDDDEVEFEADSVQPTSTVKTNTTSVVIESPDSTVTIEQISTTVTTVTVQERQKETIYQVDVTVVDIPELRSLLYEVIAKVCLQDYMNCDIVSIDAPFVSLRFTSPLYSSVAKVASVIGDGEDNITSFER